MARLFTIMIAMAFANSLGSMKVHSLAHSTERKKTYERPMHTVKLESVYDYGDSVDDDNVAVGVSPSGEIDRQLRGEPSSFMQVGEGSKKSASMMHAKQVAVLRQHQKEIASLIEEEEKAAALAKGTKADITVSTSTFQKDAAHDAAAEKEWEGASTSDEEYDLDERQRRAYSGEHSARARKSWQVDVNGVIPLRNLRDSQYVGPIGVGTEKGGNPESVINVCSIPVLRICGLLLHYVRPVIARAATSTTLRIQAPTTSQMSRLSLILVSVLVNYVDHKRLMTSTLDHTLSSSRPLA